MGEEGSGAVVVSDKVSLGMVRAQRSPGEGGEDRALDAELPGSGFESDGLWMTSDKGCLSAGLLGLLLSAAGREEDGAGPQLSDDGHRAGAYRAGLGEAGKAGVGAGLHAGSVSGV